MSVLRECGCRGHSLKLRRFNSALDDSCVRGQDGENHAGQKHQSQFVHIPAERPKVSLHACVCTRVYMFLWILTSPLQTLPAPSGAGSTCRRCACCWASASRWFSQTPWPLEQCISGGEQTAKQGNESLTCSTSDYWCPLNRHGGNIPAESLWCPVCTKILQR